MIVVPVLDTTDVVAEDGVTVVSRPTFVSVATVDEGVSVVSLESPVTLVSAPAVTTVVPVMDGVTVVTDGEYTGPRIYFSSTPPLGARVNDIWIKTR